MTAVTSQRVCKIRQMIYKPLADLRKWRCRDVHPSRLPLGTCPVDRGTGVHAALELGIWGFPFLLPSLPVPFRSRSSLSGCVPFRCEAAVCLSDAKRSCVSRTHARAALRT